MGAGVVGSGVVLVNEGKIVGDGLSVSPIDVSAKNGVEDGMVVEVRIRIGAGSG